MKAYNCICRKCGEKEDHIFKSNEIISCSSEDCNGEMTKIAGPIGGTNILPLKLGEADRFVPFFLSSTKKKINTQLEMIAAYKDLYSMNKKVKFKSEEEPLLNSHAVTEDDLDDDDDDDDEDLQHSSSNVDAEDDVDDADEEPIVAAPVAKAKAKRGRPVRRANV